MPPNAELARSRQLFPMRCSWEVSCVNGRQAGCKPNSTRPFFSLYDVVHLSIDRVASMALPFGKPDRGRAKAGTVFPEPYACTGRWIS